MLSVVTILYFGVHINKALPQYYLVADCQQPLVLLVSVYTFMWVKNLTVPHSKLINILGGVSFGVLLIHSGSFTMMDWLWKDTVDCVGHYDLFL